MKPIRRFLSAAAAVMLLSGIAAPACAFTYYPPGPSYPVGITRPTIYQRFTLGKGEHFLDVEMTLDGEGVQPVIDEENGLVFYVPAEPLERGTHTVWMWVNVSHPKPGRYYYPVESDFSFDVKEEIKELPAPTSDQLAVINYINTIRRAAGVDPVQWDRAAGAAALRHAQYMDANGVYSHVEESGKDFFTGEKVLDRIRYFGYTGIGAAEDIHHLINMTDSRRAVDDWLSGPYHRFPILSPMVTAAGFAAYGDYQVLDFVVTATRHQTVLWPYDGQQGVPVSWNAAENPNPLRLYPHVAAPVGYPISLQFGERVKDVAIDDAWVKDSGGNELTLLTYTPANDDHLRDALALIPRGPYQPGTTYTVHVEGVVTYEDGEAEPFAKTWTFTTEGSGTVQSADSDQQDKKRDGETDNPGRTGKDTGDGADAPTALSAQLTDIAGHWAEAQIRRLVEAGVVSGYPDGTFRPDNTLTRAEFVKMLVTALGLSPVSGESGPFTDTEGHWSVTGGYLGAALSAGVLDPPDYPSGRFDPDGAISREEIAVMITRAAGLEIVNPSMKQDGSAIIGDRVFTDAKAWGHPASIAAAIRAGLITGYAEGKQRFTFRPANPSTRAEAVVMVSRLLDRLCR